MKFSKALKESKILIEANIDAIIKLFLPGPKQNLDLIKNPTKWGAHHFGNVTSPTGEMMTSDEAKTYLASKGITDKNPAHKDFINLVLKNCSEYDSKVGLTAKPAAKPNNVSQEIGKKPKNLVNNPSDFKFYTSNG